MVLVVYKNNEILCLKVRLTYYMFTLHTLYITNKIDSH